MQGHSRPSPFAGVWVRMACDNDYISLAATKGRVMFQPVKISPSILSADFLNMGAEVDMVGHAGADWVHVDVMDGHFVPNLTMGVPLVKQLKKATGLLLDVHLMISNPLVQIPWFLDAGADIVTFHLEATSDEEAQRAIDLIHDAGAQAGIAIKPGTPTASVAPYVASVEMVLVMSVEPGFSGQSYIEGSDAKVADVVRLAREAGASPLIQVDGGISSSTLAGVVAAGADVLVCGNAVFAAPDPAQAIASVRAAAESAVEGVDASAAESAGAGADASAADDAAESADAAKGALA